VNSCTRRFRGNVVGIAAAATTIQDDALSAADKDVLRTDSIEHADTHATLPNMNDKRMKRIAGLPRERNAVDAEIATIVRRPMTPGHLCEWIASQVFDVELEPTAMATATTMMGYSGMGPCTQLRQHQVMSQTPGLAGVLKRQWTAAEAYPAVSLRRAN
jgi:hypothetical protein